MFAAVEGIPQLGVADLVGSLVTEMDMTLSTVETDSAVAPSIDFTPRSGVETPTIKGKSSHQNSSL